MNFTHSQKKYIKKNLKKISLGQIADYLKISENDLLQYLKSQWDKKKYQKFINHLKKSKISENIETPTASKEHLYSINYFKNYFIKNWKIFVFLGFLVIATYFNSLNNEFLSDDIAAIQNNPDINKTSYFFEPPFNLHFQSLTIFLIHKIFGLEPVFYRLLNIFAHLGSVWLIYFIFSFFSSGLIPLMTAGIFAVHPILVESVTWISGISYSHGAFWGLLAFLFYILFKKLKVKKFYFLSLVFFIIAFLFSNKLIILPIILLFYEFCFGQFKKNWLRLTPFFILVFLFALRLLSSLGERTTTLETTHYQESGLENPLIQIPIAIFSYLRLIFWPDNLTLYHSELNFTRGEYFLMVIVTLTFFALIGLAFKKNRKIFFWGSFFVITLLPFLTPLRISWIVAERYVYLGSLGIIFLVALALDRIGGLFKNKKITLIIFCLLVLSLATRSIVRNFDWRNQDTLWLSAVRTSPSSHQNHNNLGDLYARQKNFPKAIEEFQKAIELKPNYGDAYHNLANIYHQTGEEDLALKNYQKAIEFNPNLWQSYQNIAAVYFIQKKLDLAKESMEKALIINPNSLELHINMGVLYSNLGEKQKAKDEFEKALQIDPQNQVVKNQLEIIK